MLERDAALDGIWRLRNVAVQSPSLAPLPHVLLQGQLRRGLLEASHGTAFDYSQSVVTAEEACGEGTERASKVDEGQSIASSGENSMSRWSLDRSGGSADDGEDGKSWKELAGGLAAA